MKTNLNKIKTGTMLLMLSIGYARAQQAIPATGGDANGSNGTVSYTVGQVVYTANASSTGSINQGVQQPYDISTNNIEELKNISLSLYPNPTKDILKLKIEKTNITGYRYALYNNQGQLIESSEMESNEVEIRMQELVAATYILKIKSASDEFQTYTIVKH